MEHAQRIRGIGHGLNDMHQRIAIEPAFVFDDWDAENAGIAANPGADRSLKTGGMRLIRYRDGKATREVLGSQNADYGVVHWLGADGSKP
jgi:hypothetical protein